MARGAKMIVAEGVFGLIEPMHVNTGVSLAIVAGLIGTSMVVSLLAPADPSHQEVLDNTDIPKRLAEILGWPALNP